MSNTREKCLNGKITPRSNRPAHDTSESIYSKFLIEKQAKNQAYGYILSQGLLRDYIAYSRGESCSLESVDERLEMVLKNFWVMGAHRNSIYDKAYAEMYAKGMSLAETAKSIGVTRQCVYKAFKKRGFRLRTSIPCGFQIYDGKKFTLRSNGYYALTTDDRCLMHRYI